jgi:hypothetical protein
MAIRKVNAIASLYGVDDESWPESDETKSITVNRELLLHSTEQQPLIDYDMKWGGEVRLELDVTAWRLENDDVQVKTNAKLFEGTTEGTGDLDGEIEYEITVPRGRTVSDFHRVTNVDEGEDYADIRLSISNSLFEDV